LYPTARSSYASVEADSAAALLTTTAPWTPWLRFTAKPILRTVEGTAIAAGAMAFRDSVK
jgi:hypothetical protein